MTCGHPKSGVLCPSDEVILPRGIPRKEEDGGTASRGVAPMRGIAPEAAIQSFCRARICVASGVVSWVVGAVVLILCSTLDVTTVWLCRLICCLCCVGGGSSLMIWSGGFGSDGKSWLLSPSIDDTWCVAMADVFEDACGGCATADFVSTLSTAVAGSSRDIKNSLLMTAGDITSGMNLWEIPASKGRL